MSTPELTIVAEAAQGSAGELSAALSLVGAAASAGADAVKFQLVLADELATPDHELHATFRSSEMPEPEWRQVREAASSAGIDLYLDVFGAGGAAMASRLGADGLKLHASDLLNRSLIEAVRDANAGVTLLGVGGSREEEIGRAVASLEPVRPILLHGHQGYPTPVEESAIARVTALQAAFPSLEIGYADHVPAGDSRGEWMPALAIAAGATMVEKHLSVPGLDRDRESALEPEGFARFVENMQAAHRALGPGGDFMPASEERYRTMVRKHVVAARDLSAGETVTADDVALKRSTVGDAAITDADLVIGRRVTRDVAAGRAITADAMEPR